MNDTVGHIAHEVRRRHTFAIISHPHLGLQVGGVKPSADPF